jgi:redox-sensitive bicupin YhaK (pirin superfamily)
MPQQESGRMRGFQLWINLPAREKMKPASYRDIQPAEIPVVPLPGGGRARVIAGTLMAGGQPVPGPVNGLTTEPLYVDVELPGGATFSHPARNDDNVFVYAYEGSVRVGPEGATVALPVHSAGVLSRGERIDVTADAEGARFLLLSARPLGEPVVQYGPFVMNTRDEIEQAIRDYQSGQFGRATVQA